MHHIKTQLSDFSAAHRLIKGYQGNCRNLHGHNYRVYLSFATSELDDYDFVVDFSDVKSVCNQWVKANWDPGIIVSSDDQPLLTFAQDNDQKHYIIPDGKNTTVEVLCHHLYEVLTPQVTEILMSKNKHLQFTEVEIWESRTSCARFTPTLPH